MGHSPTQMPLKTPCSLQKKEHLFSLQVLGDLTSLLQDLFSSAILYSCCALVVGLGLCFLLHRMRFYQM